MSNELEKVQEHKVPLALVIVLTLGAALLGIILKRRN